jgi:hypothetical protein
MCHTRSLILLTLLVALAACAPAPSVPPISTPELTFTPQPTATPTPEPTQAPKPDGWTKDWVEVEGIWLSPEMAAYVEKHAGVLEEIDGMTYFTTTVTVAIDGQSQEVKVKLLEQAEGREMIPSYETLRELLAEEKIRQVLELSRMENAEDALFVVRSGEFMDSDLQRVRYVIQGFMDRIDKEVLDETDIEAGRTVWRRLGVMNGSFENEDGQSVFSTNVYNITTLAVKSEMVSKEKVLDYCVDLRQGMMLGFFNILDTDSIVGFLPSSNAGIAMIGIDQSVMDWTMLSEGVQGVYQFSVFVDQLLNLEGNLGTIDVEAPKLWEESSLSGLSEERQRKWLNGPVVLFNQVPESRKNLLKDALDVQYVNEEGMMSLVFEDQIIWGGYVVSLPTSVFDE